MIYSSPGIKSWYPSSMCSKYYCWFVEMGYTNLDIEQYNDGSWSIIEFYKSPVVPSLTPYNLVLGPMENTEISSSFCESWVRKLDLRIKEYWDMCEEKTRKMEEERDYLERHAQDTAERAKNLMMSNPDFIERLVRNGKEEMNITNILKNVPRHQKNGLKGVELL